MIMQVVVIVTPVFNIQLNVSVIAWHGTHCYSQYLNLRGRRCGSCGCGSKMQVEILSTPARRYY